MYVMDDEDVAWVEGVVSMLARDFHRRFQGAYNDIDLIYEGYQALIPTLLKAKNRQHFRGRFFLHARNEMKDIARKYRWWRDGTYQGHKRGHYRLPSLSPQLVPLCDPWTLRKLETVWQSLTETQRDAIDACWIGGLSTHEYGCEVGVSHASIWNRLQRSKRRFLAELKPKKRSDGS